MFQSPDAVWISTSPALKYFDRPLLHHLAQSHLIAQWEYQQTADEPSCFETALVLLHDYLKQCDRPIHLLGHGTSGLLGLLYARRYPRRVKSLTLLSVGAYPAVDWQAHYYAQRQLLPCSRQIILAQMVRMLFGQRDNAVCRWLARRLEHDLDYALSLHTLLEQQHIAPGGVAVPLLVCGSQDDSVLNPHNLQEWRRWLKLGDRLWSCPEGRHFFHYFHFNQTGKQIEAFWQTVNSACDAKLLNTTL